jgi:hypothetical protein
MCEYLFAQFSLERTQQEGVAAEQLANVVVIGRHRLDLVVADGRPSQGPGDAPS